MTLIQHQELKKHKSLFGDIPTSKPTVPKRFTQELLPSIVAKVIRCQPDHPYLVANGLIGAPCRVFTGFEETGDIECHASAAAIVSDPQGNPANVLFMVSKSDAIFEDVLIPGAQLEGCYSRIGELTNTLLCVEDYRSGLALNMVTDHGVAVVLYAENFAAVADSLRKKYPKKKIVLCGGYPNGRIARSNLATASATARKIGAFIALPEGEETFYDLFRRAGHEDVSRIVKEAVAASMAPECSTLDNPLDAPNTHSRSPNPVNGAALFDDVCAEIMRHVILPEDAVVALVLWVFTTHNLDVLHVASILALVSPVKRCAKTTLIKILAELVFRPELSCNLTPAVLFRLVDSERPTLLIDEAETFLSKSEELTGMLNAGHTRDTAFVQRLEQGKVRRYSTYCPKVVAGIGNRSATIMDRSIVIVHQRKRPEEVVTKYRSTTNDKFKALKARLVRWSEDNRYAIADAQIELPDLRNDRAVDNWEGPLTIAHCLGQGIFERAVEAAKGLTKQQDNSRCTGEELLRDIKSVFPKNGNQKVSTIGLIHALCANPEKPWSTFNRGGPITFRQFSDMLDSFGIKSKNVRIGEAVPKGYELSQFEDAFARYVIETD